MRSMTEVAALAGVTPAAVAAWVRGGRIVPAWRGKRLMVFTDDEVARFMASWRPRSDAGRPRGKREG